MRMFVDTDFSDIEQFTVRTIPVHVYIKQFTVRTVTCNVHICPYLYTGIQLTLLYLLTISLSLIGFRKFLFHSFKNFIIS